ncbi:proline-rich protein 2-like [Parus major]|uniref:proline-rich protein 2-like n=1 Tax=Parus major TaxID=9157 RepID=UPI0007713782|nr:proline-rich protein 2-like [Parus major]
MLLPAARRTGQRPRPSGSARSRLRGPGPARDRALPRERDRGGPAAREGARLRPQHRPPGVAPAGRGLAPARGGRFPRPGEKMRRRKREREGTGPCQKRRGPDGPDGRGWRGRDSPVPMARPPRARPKEGGAPRASAYGTRGRSWQGRVAPRPYTHGTRRRRGGAEVRPPPQRGGTGQGGSVRRGRPDRFFPPSATNSVPAMRLAGPGGVTPPACARQPLPPVRAGGQAPPGGVAEPIAAGPGPRCPRSPSPPAVPFTARGPLHRPRGPQDPGTPRPREQRDGPESGPSSPEPEPTPGPLLPERHGARPWMRLGRQQ